MKFDHQISSAVHIFHIFHYHRVYHKLTIDHRSMWLGCSVDRALHRYRKVMGSNPVQAQFFFFHNFKNNDNGFDLKKNVLTALLSSSV